MILRKEYYAEIMDLVNSSNGFYPLLISTINKDIDGNIYIDETKQNALVVNRLN